MVGTMARRQLRRSASRIIRIEPEEEQDIIDPLQDLRLSDLQDLRLYNLVNRVACIALWNNGSSHVVDPILFLQAGIEVLAVTMIICLIISCIFKPEIFANNVLKDRLG